jgi:hypothetical protein
MNTTVNHTTQTVFPAQDDFHTLGWSIVGFVLWFILIAFMCSIHCFLIKKNASTPSSPDDTAICVNTDDTTLVTVMDNQETHPQEVWGTLIHDE